MVEDYSQIKFDEIFIKKILTKLKVGNNRSIHLNALPGRSRSRLDLFELAVIDLNKPKNFLDVLLSKDCFSFEVSCNYTNLTEKNNEQKDKLSFISKKLDSIVIDNNDNFLEFGIKNFGFGFPMLIREDKKDSSKIIKAPLFIWNLDIEKSTLHSNKWFIKREQGASIKLNELLISHLAKDESIHLTKITEDVLEKGFLDVDDLIDQCREVFSQLGIHIKPSVDIEIEKCPELKHIKSIVNSKPWIQWSGVFGIYLSQKESIINSTEELLRDLQNFQNSPIHLDKFQTNSITSVDTDPSKDEIINTLTKSELKLIQGPPGTGKSQAITAIISNALANGARCLIVCEKKTALDVIQNNLRKAGFDEFSIVIDDVSKDRKKVIEKARENERSHHHSFSELAFDTKYEEYLKIREKLEKKYTEPLKKIFGDFTWKELLGLYLRYSKVGDFNIAKSGLGYHFLEISYEVYSHYLSVVKEAAYLYEEVEKDSDTIFSIIPDCVYQKNFTGRDYESIASQSRYLLANLHKVKDYLLTKSESECIEGDVSIFNESSIKTGKILLESLTESELELSGYSLEITKIISKKQKSLLKILNLLNNFLSDKKEIDFFENNISMFKKSSSKKGLLCLQEIINISNLITALYKQGKEIGRGDFYKSNFFTETVDLALSLFSQKHSRLINIKKNIFKQVSQLNLKTREAANLGFTEFNIPDGFAKPLLPATRKTILSNLLIAKLKQNKLLKIVEYQEFIDDRQIEITNLDVEKIFQFNFENYLSFDSFEKLKSTYINLAKSIENIKVGSVILANFFIYDCNLENKYKTSINHFDLAVKNLTNLSIKFQKIKGVLSLDDLNDLLEYQHDKIQNINNKILSLDEIFLNLQDSENKLQVIIDSGEFLKPSIKCFQLMGSFEELQNYYLSFTTSVDIIHNHIGSYENFHNWRYFETQRNEKEITLLEILKKFPASDWESIFKAWYYWCALLDHESKPKIGFNQSDKELVQLSELILELKNMQQKQVKYLWAKNREKSVSNLKHNFSILYNLAKNKNFSRRNSLRKIIEEDFKLFTSLFPVILTNPSVANSILPLKQGLFEIVIFDEASQLRISETFTCLIRGQYKIIAGDKHQMPPSSYFQSSTDSPEDAQESDSAEDDEAKSLADSESLLDYAENMRYVTKSYLDYHYRSEHPGLIEFSNHAFYGGNLIAIPKMLNYTPINFYQVGGIYTDNTNPTEVAEIIRILIEEIHPNEIGEYPSIGIATFNINQRNLIIQTLNSKIEEDYDFQHKLNCLKQKGLFVKNLENIQGDERDVIIISTTYGIKLDGSFSQNFGRINRIEGYKLLNVLITRAKHKLYICTSIPKEVYLQYDEIIQANGENNRSGIFYAYLAYAEAISNNEAETAENILKMLKKQSYDSARLTSQNEGMSESPFEEEVYQELLDYFGPGRISQQVKAAGFRLDFVLKTKYKNIALECDGKEYHETSEAYAYDLHRQKELEKIGYIVYRIWSTNWFQTKDIEIKKLLDFVQSLEIVNNVTLENDN